MTQHTSGPWAANARLIAAAPELLVALQVLTEVIADDEPPREITTAMIRALAAIAKVETL